MLKIFLFGHLHVQMEGIPLKLAAPPKTIPLWSYLLLRRAAPVPRDTLAYTLWPDESEAAARANLRRHLHQLQRTLPEAPLGQPWLIIDTEVIQWNPQAGAWLDVAEFEHLSTGTDTLARAVRIYASDLLENIDEDWLFYERERLRNLFFNDLFQLIQYYRELGNYTKAIAYADRLLTHDPLREDAVRQIMALQYRSGNRAGALAEYVRFERRLRQKLNVEPMPETSAWYETILRNAPLPDTASARDNESSGVQDPFRLPFVGRETELSILNKYWAEAARQEGNVILISGENGIGKSRLSARIAQTAEASGGRVLKGSTTYTEPLPYQAFSEILRSALPFLKTMNIDHDLLAALSPLVPELSVRQQDLPALIPDRNGSGQKLFFENLAHCLEILAMPRPLLLILENMHWAGRSSMLLLEYLARRVPENAILILVTFREEDNFPRQPLQLLRRRLQREGRVKHIALTPLSESEIWQIVVQLRGSNSSNTELVKKLNNLSQGNPLFLSEILRDWLSSESSAFNRTQGHFLKMGSKFPDFEVHLIPGIQAIISNRLARLSPHSRSLAEICAVIGQAFDLDILREVSGWSEARVLQSIDELIDLHLVRETATNSSFEFEFSHPLIQSTLYDQIPVSIRKHRHHRVAHIMQALYTKRTNKLAGALAFHFEAAGEYQSAAEYYLSAARQALVLQAQDQGLRLLQHALKFDCEPHIRFKLLLLQDSILSKLNDEREQEKDLAELKQLALSIQDEELICESLLRQIDFEHANRSVRAEARSISSFKAHASSSRNPYWQAVALQTDAFLNLQIGQTKSACEKLYQALEIYRSIDKFDQQVICLCGLAEVAIYENRYHDVPSFLNEARSISTSPLPPQLTAYILNVACKAAIEAENFPAALALGKRVLEIYQSILNRRGEAEILINLAKISIWLDRNDQAQQYIDQARAIYTTVGNRSGKAWIRMVTAELAIHLGRFPAGTTAIQDAEAIFREIDALQMQAYCAYKLSQLWFEQNMNSEAQITGQRALKLARQVKNPSLEAAVLTELARIVRESGETDLALGYLKASLELEETHPLRQAKLITLSELAITNLSIDQLPKAQKYIETVLEGFTGVHRHVREIERLLWAAAYVYHTTGKFERSQQLLSQAHVMVSNRLASFAEPDSRAAYLKNRTVRQILAAYKDGEWPETEQ